MKNTFYIYIIALLLVVTAIFSGKSEVSKMKQSGFEVNAIFFRICSLYQEQGNMVQHLRLQLDDSGLIPPDSFPGSSVKAPYKLPQSLELTFTLFSDYEGFQKTLDQKVLLIDSIFLVLSRNKKNDMAPLLKNLNNQTEEIKNMKINYNEKARGYNSFIKTFPRNIYSILFHFQIKPYYKEKRNDS